LDPPSVGKIQYNPLREQARAVRAKALTAVPQGREETKGDAQLVWYDLGLPLRMRARCARAAVCAGAVQAA
jgi:hypothetical protein